jgi:hypothetical protein
MPRYENAFQASFHLRTSRWTRTLRKIRATGWATNFIISPSVTGEIRSWKLQFSDGIFECYDKSFARSAPQNHI